MGLALLLLLAVLALAAPQPFRAVVHLRRICTRGDGVHSFVTQEQRNFPMSIARTDQTNADLVTFEDLTGSPVEVVDVSEMALEQIVKLFEDRGLLQYGPFP